ncbi:MAG: DUF4105 domain-containing protein [Gammaproteobacteria bacterium]|nr:DUF4105 domain-containing protein [Gammaproteobacteria bacterium]
MDRCLPSAIVHILALLLPTFLLNSIANANTTNHFDADSLIEQAKAKRLSERHYWHALVHYRHDSSTESGYSSEIISPEFFLAKDGNRDPEAELEATLRALLKQPEANPNTHAQCRFVARYHWLRTSLDWRGITVPAVNCSEYAAWTHNNHIESLSLVFATGYLSNPASYYGHLLLKFNTERSVLPTDLLDESINFGAIIPDNENGLVYVLRGLFGGYKAGFSSDKFYKLNHLYAENDLRDLWEYKLNLTPDEVRQIADHTWELMGKNFTYYFIDKNCAYRMAELLELVVDQPLLPDIPWSLPSDVFEHLMRVKHHGNPLVENVSRIPSRLNRFYDSYRLLDNQQKYALRQVVSDDAHFNSAQYQELKISAKVAVIDTLLDYYEFRIVSDKHNPVLLRNKRMVLIERAKLPPETNLQPLADPNAQNAAPPHEGPLPDTLRVGVVHNNQYGDGVFLRIRPAYYDTLETDNGRISNSYLTMFDLSVFYLNDAFQLRKLDFVKVETLNASHTSLPGDGGLAWDFSVGIQSQDLACSNCSVVNIKGGFGKAVSIAPNFTLLGMLDFFGQSNHQEMGTLGVIPRIGILISAKPFWKTNLSLGEQRYLNGSHSKHTVIQWENRFGSSRNWDIRLAFQKQIASEYQISASYYW